MNRVVFKNSQKISNSLFKAVLIQNKPIILGSFRALLIEISCRFFPLNKPSEIIKSNYQTIKQTRATFFILI